MKTAADQRHHQAEQHIGADHLRGRQLGQIEQGQ